jgi:hypothetical protein
MSDPTEPTQTVVKTLFAYSGNVCAFFDEERRDGCEKPLTNPSWKRVQARICHIAGRQPGSARYDAAMSDEDRRDFDNLIVLCPNHHTQVDDLEPDRFSVEILTKMKARGMEHAGSLDRWVKGQNIDQRTRQLLLQMREVWAGLDSGAGREQSLRTISRDDGMIEIAKMGPGTARNVTVTVIGGPEQAIQLADIQGFTIEEDHPVTVGQIDRANLPESLGRHFFLEVKWTDNEGADRQEELPLFSGYRS